MGNDTEILIDDGAKEYTFKNLHGEVFAKFCFNPTDTGILDRYEGVVKFFEGIANSIASVAEDDMETEIKRLDKCIKEQFDLLCGKNVSDGLFSVYAPMTLFANGDFYAEVALDKISSFIEKEMNVRLEKKKARIRKDIAKRK